MLDKLSGLCYTTIRKKEGKPTKPERMTKMTFEYYEIMNTYLTEVQEWMDFEADMATNPYDDPWLS